jgi:hypothetical protein|tara:strand:+ start:228 stop:749 length:522 start_codon:yes stop_codon:yes gene_type:complete
MNIFFLSDNPDIAAEMACDRHSIKMILESAQMLSTSLRLHGYDEKEYIYGSTHVSHPSTIWTATNRSNFEWVLSHALALCREYTARYGKFHKSEEILYRCADFREAYIPAGSLTVPPKCMGLEYKIGESNWDDVVASYRNYYRKGKSYMNKGKGPQWNKIPTRRPSWFLSPSV